MNLTEPMLQALRIMAEGHEIEYWEGISGWRCWDFTPSLFPYSPPHAGTVRALERRKLIREEGSIERPALGRVLACYALTKAGRRAAAEV